MCETRIRTSYPTVAIGLAVATLLSVTPAALGAETTPVAARELGTSAAKVVRGPYLQVGRPRGVTVAWRTNRKMRGAVHYGERPDQLTSIAKEPKGTRNDHLVTLQGLAPERTYYYAVGKKNAILTGGDDQHFFVTSPERGADRAMRLWVLGDPGTASFCGGDRACSAAAVKRAYQQWAGDRPADLWFMLGDNAYNQGTDAEYQKAVFETYPEILRNTVLWTVAGNHEYYSGSFPAPYYDIFHLPTRAEAGGVRSKSERYYSFDYGNVHFIALDTFYPYRSPCARAGAQWAERAPADSDDLAKMMRWLKKDLRKAARSAKSDWIIAFFHHPPYSKGSHDSDNATEVRRSLCGGPATTIKDDPESVRLRRDLLPLLERFGVDLVLTAHSHSYERSKFIHGHYDSSSTFGFRHLVQEGYGHGTPESRAYSKDAGGHGTVYVVVGCSGQVDALGAFEESFDHPANLRFEEPDCPGGCKGIRTLGSLVVDIEGDELAAFFIDVAGLPADEFRVTK